MVERLLSALAIGHFAAPGVLRATRTMVPASLVNRPLYEWPTTRPRSREPTIEQAVVYNFTWQLTSVSAQRRHSGPHLAAFQISLYFVPCAPHRSHLLPRSQRKLVVDVFRTRLGPIAVAQQRFRVDRRREFDHGIKRVTATDRRLAIDKRTEIGSTNRTHR